MPPLVYRHRALPEGLGGLEVADVKRCRRRALEFCAYKIQIFSPFDEVKPGEGPELGDLSFVAKKQTNPVLAAGLHGPCVAAQGVDGAPAASRRHRVAGREPHLHGGGGLAARGPLCAPSAGDVGGLRRRGRFIGRSNAAGQAQTQHTDTPLGDTGRPLLPAQLQPLARRQVAGGHPRKLPRHRGPRALRLQKRHEAARAPATLR